MNTKNKIEEKLKEYFNVHTLQIIDESHKHANHKKDTQGKHFRLLIVSDDFIKLNLIKRHQLIYNLLSDMLKTEIHALSMKLLTSEEYKD